MKSAETISSHAVTQPKAASPFFKKGNDSFLGNNFGADAASFFGGTKTPVPAVNGRIIQAKLSIGQPNDKYEKEADSMADQVVQRLAMPEIGNKRMEEVRLKKIDSSSNSLVQPKCSKCEQEENSSSKEDEKPEGVLEKVQRKSIFESGDEPPNEEEAIQRKCAACENDEQLVSRKVLGEAKKIKNNSIVQRTCRECEEGDKVMLKPFVNIQCSSSDRSPDADGSRTSIVSAAEGELGKVEARLNDGTGRRVGAERLLEYFHIAAPGVWDDSLIETAGAEMPSWCGIFSVWAHKKAGKNIGEWQMGKGVSAFNTLSQTDSPQPGDIGYIHEPNQHHALVKSVEGDNITTIDGNSGLNSEVKENSKLRTDYTGFLTAFGGSGSPDSKIQTKKSSIESGSNGADSIEDRLSESTGKGMELPKNTLEEMESSFGADFESVRIHTDSSSISLSKDLNAQAFTHGNDIYFNSGKFNPTSESGKHLLAHELTHTIQQEGGEKVQRQDDEERGEEPFEGAFALSDRHKALKEYENELMIEYADSIVYEDGSFSDLIDLKLEISRVKREGLIIETIIWNGLLHGLNGRSADDLIEEAYSTSFDDEATLRMIIGEGMDPDQALEAITDLVLEMPELFPDYIISLYALAVEELNEKAQTHHDEYIAAINALNERPVEEIAEDFVWMMENRDGLRREAGMVHFFTWLDMERPYFLERKDEGSTSVGLENIRVRINDTSIDFTRNVTIENLDFLHPLLVSWHHHKFYEGVATKLDFFRLMVEATYERLNEYGSYPDLAADMERAYYGQSPQVTHDTMRDGFDDIYGRIESKLNTWVQNMSWDERIREGFGLYDLYGEVGTLLKQMVTLEAIAMMVGFIAFLIAIQYVPYANIVVDAILIALGGIDILKGLVIFGSYFDRSSEATTFRQLYRAAQNLKGGGEAILNLLMELIGLAASRALKSYTRYRSARRFENIEDIATHEVITRGSADVRRSFGEATTSSRTFRQWEEGINAESRTILRENPDVRKIYSEMRTDVRRVFTHCASPCIIPGITRRQVEIVTNMIDRLGGLSTANYSRLKVLFHIGQNDLEWIMRMVARVENEAQLDRVVLQEFRRRAMEPPGGSPNIDQNVARATPGTCTGGENLPNIVNGAEWLRPSGGSVALIPRSIANLLRGRTFANFGEMRAAFWRAVAEDSVLNRDFSPSNLAAMRNGEAPVAIHAQQSGGQISYQLHHVTPIEHGGAVYDLNNIVVASPAYHGRVHNTGFNGGDPFLVQPKLNSNSDSEQSFQFSSVNNSIQLLGEAQETPEGSCPTYEANEISKSRSPVGWLPLDFISHSADQLLLADFGNNQSTVKPAVRTEPNWIYWKDRFTVDNSYRLQLIGYSDCSGNEEVNISIRHARALAIERALGSGINNKLSFRGMAGLGQMVTSNDTPENRAKNRSVVVEYKQGFFFDSEAFENAQRANGLIQTALTELSASSEARERNVPAYITQRGISIGPLTPRHDTTTTTPAVNFFAGTIDYANSFALPSSTRFHIYNSNTGIGIQVRVVPDLIGAIPLTDIKERIVQAVSQIAQLAAVGSAAAGTSFEQYKAQFNAWWDVSPYNTINTEFNPALNSFGPRTNRAREIFKKIYDENATIKNDYDNNTGAIKEKIDTYNIREGLNLINSPRLQTLREVFSANVPPISNANYPAFKTAIEAAAANLDSDDRIAVSSSNDWQRLINQYLTEESKRQEIRTAIDTPPSVPAPAPAPAPVPGPSSGGGAAARTFLNSISIDGPTAPITANNSIETVILSPISTRPNPGLNFSTKFTVTPAPRVIGNNVSAESAWPSGINSGAAFDPQISNNGNVTMNAHLDLVNMPSGITPPAVSDLPFVVNDNRNAHFLANWNPNFQYALPGGDIDWYNVGDTVRYVGGSQQFRISAWLPNGSLNPGLTLSVVSRLKKGGAIVQDNTSSPQSFPINVQSSSPIPFNISAPASVPVAGENFDIEVDIIDSAATVLGTKTIHFTVMPELVYTQAAAITEAIDDNNFYHDNSATGLLGIMTALGGTAARVAAAVNTPVADGGIVLLPMTARHDSAAFVETTQGSPDPSKTGYFAGIDYSHSMVDVAGAAGFRTYSFPDLGDKVIVLNRTTDIPARSKRSNDSIITLLTHEAVHAMDARPNSDTVLERYKTEFRAYWMDGRFGPPTVPICPVGLVGCTDAVYNSRLQPPGPKSGRARAIFDFLYSNPITYPWVKQAYDNDISFRESVDNYEYPDGINLMVSVRLERLRSIIEGHSGTGFAALRTQVRQFVGLEVPAPASGVLDNDEKAYIHNSRAWRDLVERKIAIPADRSTLKSDLGIPTTVGP